MIPEVNDTMVERLRQCLADRIPADHIRYGTPGRSLPTVSILCTGFTPGEASIGSAGVKKERVEETCTLKGGATNLKLSVNPVEAPVRVESSAGPVDPSLFKVNLSAGAVSFYAPLAKTATDLTLSYNIDRSVAERRVLTLNLQYRIIVAAKSIDDVNGSTIAIVREFAFNPDENSGKPIETVRFIRCDAGAEEAADRYMSTLAFEVAASLEHEIEFGPLDRFAISREKLPG
ncbi:MAG: hypothetical protein QCH35_11240 [Methanomicrobiaceae archaeon]|nr:hypothetical protein [Methanomicrobiaceae archaeon]